MFMGHKLWVAQFIMEIQFIYYENVIQDFVAKIETNVQSTQERLYCTQSVQKCYIYFPC